MREKIELEVNNVIYTEFKSFRVKRTIESVTGEFNIDITRSASVPFPVKAFDDVKIRINNTPVISGYISKWRSSLNGRDNNIAITGYDYTQDFVQSTVGSLTKFGSGVTLNKIIQTYLNYLGLTEVKLINEVGAIDPFLANEIVQVNPTDKIFDVCMKYAKKRQLFLTTDGLGNIVITRPSDDQDPLSTFYLKYNNEANNNAIGAEVDVDYSIRYHTYTARNQENPASAKGRSSEDYAKIVTTVASVVDNTVRKSRKIDYTFDSLVQRRDVINRLKWQVAFDLANSIEYRITVPTFINQVDTSPIRPNTTVYVDDDVNGVHDILLIGEVTYSLSVSDGIKAELVLKHPNAYETSDDDLINAKRKRKRKKRKRIIESSIFDDAVKILESE